MAIMIAVMFVLFTVGIVFQAEAANFTCPTAIFSFGDSLTDTGNYASAFPAPPYIKFHSSYEKAVSSGRLPYRACNGRLLIDFTAQAFKFPFLDGYFKDIDPNYQHGVNFATSSSTARNTSEASPFFLSTQISQLIKFKNDALSSSDSNLPATEAFSTGLYWISIGLNDFLRAFAYSGLSLDQINVTLVPQVAQFISNAVRDLYNYAGARNFIVLNVPAVGCLPSVVSSLGTGAANSTDSFGCLHALNEVVQSYNSLLKTSLQQINQVISDATITYADYYGFQSNATLLACCEDGAHYSGPAAHCSSTATTCTNPSGYISWDGIHFTEAFNKVVATKFLEGTFIDRAINLKTTCSLDFSQF
ncbi:hypothetical protein O6H91_10G055100 [Diphasiastrum complanatum]|uniref:Uncharacterized protein n=1 Tax=Diphasiastrum complanatum TaxID=34168 RepID=A0ACC2CHC1_DIPCM|nr:hypothetical protein O6H91_10G055100 [Diphasiastrum complanatum]